MNVHALARILKAPLPPHPRPPHAHAAQPEGPPPGALSLISAPPPGPVTSLRSFSYPEGWGMALPQVLGKVKVAASSAAQGAHSRRLMNAHPCFLFPSPPSPFSVGPSIPKPMPFGF